MAVAQPTMHPCLLIPEIAGLIVRALGAPGSEHQDQTTLARLARTSRIFHSHALDAFWHRQVGLANLIKCMPADCWKEVDCEVSFTRPLAKGDWERFDYYAHRVRAFTMNRDTRVIPLRNVAAGPQSKIRDGAYLLLALGHPGPVLPNVVNLDWREGSVLEYCRMFIGRKLQSLGIHAAQESISREFLPGLLSHIGAFSPPLVSCNLNLRQLDGGYASSVEKICQLRALHNLSLGCQMPLPVSAFNMLATLPSLETLIVHIDENSSLDGGIKFMNERNPTAFCSLKKLVLSTVTTISPISVFETSNFDVLSWLTVHLENASNLDKLMLKICDRCPTEHLRDLYIYSEEATPPDPGSVSEVSSETLWRVTQYPHIRHLTISTECRLHLDNELAISMATSWPSLQVLYLMRDLDSSGWEQTSALTLDCLPAFVLNCTELVDLALPLSVSTSHCYCLGLVRYDGIPNELITRLTFGGRFAGDSARVAAYLSQFFPDVVEINGWTTPLAPGDTWQEVEGYLPAFTIVRKQERRPWYRKVIR